MIFPRLLATVFCVLPLAPIAAHEFWIEPERYRIEPGAPVMADFKNGEAFKGNTLSYFDRSSARFDLGFQGDLTPVTARAGDSPALQLPDGISGGLSDGLLVVLHETSPSSLNYKTWEKFAKFAAHKDFPDADAEHRAAGWPRENFRESYTRHAKSLIAVGSGAGADKEFGLATEFVALTNPYDPDFDGLMKVALHYGAQMRGDAQVEVFDRAPDGTVTITLHRTDAAGHAAVPVTKGHDYLFDAVILRPFAQGENDKAPVWETLWASLTFAVPQ